MEDQFNFSNFTLPFFEEIESENLDDSDVFEKMEDMIPKEAEFCGSINTFEQGWTESNHKFEFYIIPYKEEDFDWALFRINWDDNFMKWGWVGDVRLKTATSDSNEAAKKMLTALFKKWVIDVDDAKNSVYRELI